ncbi:MAG: hypothetical protein ABSC65_08540 [Acidobacteriaceae bacterium]
MRTSWTGIEGAGAYTFQVLSSRLQPGCAEGAIDNGLLDLIKADER